MGETKLEIDDAPVGVKRVVQMIVPAEFFDLSVGKIEPDVP